MPRKSFKAGGFGLSIEVPESVGKAVKRIVRPRNLGEVHGGLFISPTTPVLNVTKRDPQATAEAFRSNNPDTQGSVKSKDSASLRERVESLEWYHTIELPDGIVTRGHYDHRPLVAHYGIPSDLQGKRVLDVATFDGFWAFEFERRGAQVVAVDLPRLSDVDFPPRVKEALLDKELDQDMGHGFALASQALDSKVERQWKSIYEIDPASMGMFDLVHIADVLLHLERPLDALRALHSVSRGDALIVDSFDPSLQDPRGRRLTQYLGGWWDVTWWLPSLDTLAQMVIDAGFSDVSVHRIYNIAKANEAEGYWRAVIKAKH